mgnify:CR=1 FL=1
MNKLCLRFLFVFCIAATAALAQTQLPWSVVGSGGGIGAQAGQRLLSGTIGQPLIGIVAVTNGSKLSQGFWLPIPDTLVSVSESDGGTQLAADVTNYPNPFSSTTTIRFSTPLEGAIQVNVYDLAGNRVRSIRTELSLAGGQEIVFDGLTDNGAPLGSGTYLYEVTGIGLDGQPFRKIQRLTIVR